MRHGRVNFQETNFRAGPIDSANELERSDIVMGVGSGEEGLWNKRFKFRFISKNSGKKFDVNARFRYIVNTEKDKERRRRNSSGAQLRAVAPDIPEEALVRVATLAGASDFEDSEM